LLDEYRQIYEHVADAWIEEDWRKENKNNLFYRCIEYELTQPKKSEAYLCAIIVRYWHLVSSYYAKGKGAYTVEDVHDWLLDVIHFALKDRPWVQGSGNRLEGDKNGPDKYVNVCLKSRILGFYQWSNAAKRQQSFTEYSLEKAMEDSGDSKLPEFDDSKNIDFFIDLRKYIRNEFKNKNYMHSFLVDGIINAPVIEHTKEEDGIYTQFNKKKLSKHIRLMDDSYCKTFARMYGLSEEEVLHAKNECSQLSSTRIYTILKHSLNQLAQSPLVR
jgi:hypothetical protein